MTTTTDVIKAYRKKFAGVRLTAHDIGETGAELVLGLKCDDEIDIWYAALNISESELYLGPAYWYAHKKILYFPDLVLDAEAFAELLNEDR